MSNVNDIINAIIDRKTFVYKKIDESTEGQIRPEYNLESESIYK